jgi:hypothetical protein
MRFLRSLSLLAPVILSSLACSSIPAVEGGAAERQLGEVRVESASFRELTSRPTSCISGENFVFLGAEFSGGGEVTTRLILPPEGSAKLRLFRSDEPLEQGLLFTRADCRQFEVEVERTGWQINEIHDLRVRLRFDCSNDEGSASGSLTADHCH